MRNWILPTTENNYTPKLLKRKSIVVYTLVLLLFNIFTAHLSIFRAYANVDTQSLFELHNQVRKEHNLEPLKLNSKLNESAYNKAIAMLESDCWDHYCPDGKSPWEFFDEAGYDYIYAGENLAEGFTSNQKLFNAWMNSKTHRENILREDFQEIGIAVVYGKFQDIENNAIVVVHFGTQLTNYDADSNNTILEKENKSLQITSPKEGEIINDNTPTIEGTSPKGKLEIDDNQTTIGESIAEEGLFTYRIPDENKLNDGSHLIEVKHKTFDISDSVNIKVDTIPPVLDEIQFDSIIKDGNKKFVILNINASEDTQEIFSAIPEISIYKHTETLWKIKIPEKQFEDITTITLTSVDKANNRSEQEFKLNDIKGAFYSHKEQFEENNRSLNINILQKLDTRRIVNSLFILAILALIILDYYALKQTELPLTVIRSKTQYHFSMFLILFLISIAGGTAGELLTAQSL